VIPLLPDALCIMVLRDRYSMLSQRRKLAEADTTRSHAAGGKSGSVIHPDENEWRERIEKRDALNQSCVNVAWRLGRVSSREPIFQCVDESFFLRVNRLDLTLLKTSLAH